MSAPDPSKKLQSLLKRLKTEFGEGEALGSVPAGLPDEFGRVLPQLIYSALVWEASRSQAAGALRRLGEQVVDLNELRVCFATEIAAMLGERYPRAQERAERLRAMLTEIYKREHGLNIDRLESLSKRDARTYLETLDGMTEFVCARVVLLSLGGHAIPCDERLRDLLAGEGVLGAETPTNEAAAWLERQVRAGDGASVSQLFQAYSDAHGSSAKKEKKPEPVAAVKKTKAAGEGKGAKKAPVAAAAAASSGAAVGRGKKTKQSK